MKGPTLSSLLFSIFLIVVLSETTTSSAQAKEKLKSEDDESREHSNGAQREFTSTHQYNRRSHILMYHPWGTRSLRGQQNALLFGLLDKGHTITGVFSEKSNLKHENYTEIIINSRYITFITHSNNLS